MTNTLSHISVQQHKTKSIKCLVWDLDHTLWHGILLENDSIVLRDQVRDIIQTLDSRGILQSIASKNDYDTAMAKLRTFGLEEYFLYPQIHWSSKAHSIETIAKQINIGLDTIAFIDDQPFEREEVQFLHPDVLCLDANELDRLLAMPEMNPRFMTVDSRQRRQMYLADIQRKQDEDSFVGPQEDFLATLDMVFSVSHAQGEDLARAEELTVRTNQLNATGYTYSYEELHRFQHSPTHQLLMASLNDKYGSYGKIGLALLECHDTVWNIKLLIMSCRVMSRGVGTILLHHIMRLAKEAQVRLNAEFVATDRNRMMRITYKFAGFRESHQQDGVTILEHPLDHVPDSPSYVRMRFE